jgi:prepilin-type N-terminal cleavage/methylation domain-containing protein
MTPRKNDGFTLLEVLVALAVLSLGAALTLSLVSGSLRNIRKVQLRNRAIQHAETVLEIALLDDSVKQPTKKTGDFEDGTRFSVEIEEYQPSAQQQERLTAEQILQQEQQARLPLRLFCYTVEVFGPESAVPDFRIQTLKVVNVTDPLHPMGIQ